MSNVTVQEALKAAIEALEMASEDAKEWAMQYVTSDNAPISVRQYVADKTEPALNELKAALADIEKCEPVYLISSGVHEIAVSKAKYDEWTSSKRISYTSPQPRDWDK